MSLSSMSDEQLDRKIEAVAGDVADYRKDFERAQSLYRDEPTRAHHDNLQEAKRFLKWAEGQLRKFRAERDGRRGD
ncbi:MAG TPA: hypothetical protein VIP46_22495 [Pyrinomonadaceae bacterium]